MHFGGLERGWHDISVVSKEKMEVPATHILVRVLLGMRRGEGVLRYESKSCFQEVFSIDRVD